MPSSLIPSEITYMNDINRLEEVLPPFLSAAEADPTFGFVDVNLKFDKPELRVAIDRERARDQDISALRIAQTMQLALSEQRLGYFVMDGKQYEVIGQVERGSRDETVDLRNLYVTAPGRPPVLSNHPILCPDYSWRRYTLCL